MEKRKYQTQKQRDMELVKAYQKGILDERKEWMKIEKENFILKHREKRAEGNCFCKGHPIWRKLCAECQDWEKEILKKERGRIVKSIDEIEKLNPFPTWKFCCNHIKNEVKFAIE